LSQWKLKFERRAVKDAHLLRREKLWNKTIVLFDVLRANPFQNPPPYEKLGGEFKGLYSRRINAKHRLVYAVKKKEKIVKILQMWTHYE